jgi:hypothetical protein
MSQPLTSFASLCWYYFRGDISRGLANNGLRVLDPKNPVLTHIIFYLREMI